MFKQTKKTLLALILFSISFNNILPNMFSDTPILMGNGTHKNIANLKVGNEITMPSYLSTSLIEEKEHVDICNYILCIKSIKEKK
jgi:hypothetical protein